MTIGVAVRKPPESTAANVGRPCMPTARLCRHGPAGMALRLPRKGVRNGNHSPPSLDCARAFFCLPLLSCRAAQDTGHPPPPSACGDANPPRWRPVRTDRPSEHALSAEPWQARPPALSRGAGKRRARSPVLAKPEAVLDWDLSRPPPWRREPCGSRSAGTCPATHRIPKAKNNAEKAYTIPRGQFQPGGRTECAGRSGGPPRGNAGIWNKEGPEPARIGQEPRPPPLRGLATRTPVDIDGQGAGYFSVECCVALRRQLCGRTVAVAAASDARGWAAPGIRRSRGGTPRRKPGRLGSPWTRRPKEER